ncbi:MAG: dehydrogenase, partial [Planctomycetes bacterium SCN 63-9]
DGWIYWCKGAFATQTYERAGKPPFVTRAAHIFRCRPEGGEIEPVMTGGMDNPVDVAFTPGGERIFTTTFLVNPGGGQRDGLIHAVYGGINGKDQAVIYDPVHKWTGPNLMPVLLHMGAAAPSGLTRLESDSFGEEYRDNLFAAYFNLHKVGRHVLTPQGASFTTRDEDFVSSPDFDFHPTDVIEDADGSLIVIDTGGWYKLCCPSSQFHRPDVLGGVYRISRKGAPKVDDPRGLSLAWGTMTADALAALLADPRPAVRERAIQALAAKGQGAIQALDRAGLPDRPVVSRRNDVWAATRIDCPDARGLVRNALKDADESVRQAAIHSASLWRDPEAVPQLMEILAGSSAQNARAAAEALGRIGDKVAVPALLDAAERVSPSDQVLAHSITYALIEIGDPKGTAAGLDSANVSAKRTALVALDQMEGGGLDARRVASLLTDANPTIRQTASWIVGHHPEWAEALAGTFRQRLAGAGNTLAAADRAELEQQLAKFSGTPAIQELLANRAEDVSSPEAVRLSALKAMALARPKEIPASWVKALAAILSKDQGGSLAGPTISTARALAISKEKGGTLGAGLLAMGNDANAPAPLRLEALAAVPGGLAPVSPELFDFLVKQLAREQAAATRILATEVLAKATLSKDQLNALAVAIKEAGPLEVDRLLTLFANSNDDATGKTLIASLKGASAFTSLRVDAIKASLAKFSPEVQKEAEEIYARINVDAAGQKEKLERLVSTLAAGDVRRGQIVFHSEKAACFTCHAIGYRGGKVGPDLSRIGQIRADRDLLEAIVFPSASFVRSFEPVVVATSDGKVVNGLLKSESGDEMVLTTGANQEARIARGEIEEIRPSTVSVMPAGLDQQLTPQDLADLVAYLKACK